MERKRKIDISKSIDITQLWYNVCNYLNKADKLPIENKVYNEKLDEDWEIWINGCKTEQKIKNLTLMPYHLYVEYRGIAFILSNANGGVVGTKEIADYNELLKTIESKKEKLK